MQTAKLWVALKQSQGGHSWVLLLLRTFVFVPLDLCERRGGTVGCCCCCALLYLFLLTYVSPVRDEPVVVLAGGVTYQVFEVKEQM